MLMATSFMADKPMRTVAMMRHTSLGIDPHNHRSLA
jgi:hypothetical protein